MQYPNETALFRYQVLSKVLIREFRGEQRSKAVKAVSKIEHLTADNELVTVSDRSIYRWLSAYEMLGDIKNTLLAFERSTALAPEKDEYQASLASALEKLPDEIPDTEDNEPEFQVESKLETAPLIDRTIGRSAS